MRAAVQHQYAFSVLLLAALFHAEAVARDGNEPEGRPKPAAPAPLDVIYRPTAMPDRILLTWNADPARTQSVTWRTAAGVERALAEIALAEDGPLFVRKSRRVRATTVRHEADLGPANYHCVTFTDLRPSTVYADRRGPG